MIRARGRNYMKVLYFELDGFKNIENVHIDLSDITTLMALNCKGKSNLLKGILFGLLMISNTPETRNAIYHTYGPLSKPLLKSYKDKDYRFEVGVKTSFENKEVIVFYNFTLKWDQKEAMILTESLKIQEATLQRHTTYYLREGLEAKYKSARTRGADNLITLSSPNEMFLNLLLGKKLFYESILKEIGYIRYAIDRHFDNSQTYNSITLFQDDDFSFCGNKPENTPQNMYLLKTNYPRYFSRIVNAMEMLFPDIIEIDVKKVNNNINVIGVQNYYLLYAKQNHIDSYINCSEMSDGFKRILNNLIFLSISEIKGLHVVALEEPENSINPTVLGKYIQIIAEFSDSMNIILTSHSPYLLQYISLLKIYIGVENDKGNINFKKIKPTYIKRVTERSERLDVTTGTFIFDSLSDKEKFDNEIISKALED